MKSKQKYPLSAWIKYYLFNAMIKLAFPDIPKANYHKLLRILVKAKYSEVFSGEFERNIQHLRKL